MRLTSTWVQPSKCCLCNEWIQALSASEELKVSSGRWVQDVVSLQVTGRCPMCNCAVIFIFHLLCFILYDNGISEKSKLKIQIFFIFFLFNSINLNRPKWSIWYMYVITKISNKCDLDTQELNLYDMYICIWVLIKMHPRRSKMRIWFSKIFKMNVYF